MREPARFVVAFLFLIVAIPIAAFADGRPDHLRGSRLHQIVVVVDQAKNGLRFEIETPEYKNREYSKSDANFWLADLRMREGASCQIIEIIDDRVPLAAITEVSEMAVNAGFTDIRPFAYWHKTGRMAQVQFGEPIKFSRSTEKLTQRIEQAK